MPGLELLGGELSAIRRAFSVGRIEAIEAGLLRLRGLEKEACLGDLVHIGAPPPEGALGEVVAITPESVTVLAAGTGHRALAVGERVFLVGAARLSPHDGWLGRVIDPLGRPLDGRELLRGSTARDTAGPPPPAAQRRTLGARLETGMRVFNTLLPIVRGQRIGLFAGSGVGKSTLLARLAVGLAADVVVIALVGERSRELREFTDRVLGPTAMRRAVVVAATSDQPPMLRRRCAPAAMTIAEWFRDQGRQVLFLCDSVTRLAEAHREVALAAGETASLGGYPPSIAPLITQLCERAGPGAGASGDITAVFSVLVPGSDMEEPVADILRGVLDSHVVLDRQIAERGRFPAIDLLRSVSRSLPEAASAEENALINRARRLLGAYAQSELMIRAGLHSPGSDPELDAAIRAWPALDAFIAEREPQGIAESFSALARCLSLADEAEATDVHREEIRR
ncbi:flagellum-specific ATP synthase [Meinhardsimonia xiamenensis]|jgi:flagellum-specific ATP synthase|uniref:Flagellum-specific ATP synthase n=1 Tax=Meinhardsimonia xiamenensis TaxID=990712 RepID=A0A1G9E977_9RHOB|nr:FliI/YscN family ATPase [Meinhardsimonia xiamenensis]PRX33874.1 flagellum-specific ATP synthase [Meinhardsimonia xiamenensis]SDK72667.1 flagellum-specific ATP synthase [Meinhardsimonia xiamenensis]